MFSLGFGEILIICVILIVVVGPERLPGLMKGVGKTMRTVREASRDLRGAIGIDEMMREDVLRPTPKPRKPPPAAVSRDAPPAGNPGADASAAAGADPAANGSASAPGADAGASASAEASAGAGLPRPAPPSTVVPGSVRSPFPKPGAAQASAADAPPAAPRSSAPPPISAPPPAGVAESAQPDGAAPAPSTEAPSERKP
jgi:sec-independent protein translocase protein TatB